MSKELIKAEHLKKYFTVKRKMVSENQVLKAVDDVSFSVNEGEVLGLVGESGCGKSTLGRTILKIHSITDGDVYFRGRNIKFYGFQDMRSIRKDMQMIFQDPYASLNPRMSIADIVRGPLDVFKIGEKDERTDKVVEMLKIVGLSEEYLYKYPHEMSGGQRQRVVIARAMISNPAFVVCDEPVSALDVSVRAQVLNLMKDMQEQFGTAYLFISHDLSTVRYICDRIAVMYLGHIVEIANAKELFDYPSHPYTQALLSSIPIPDVDQRRKRIILGGDVPSPINPPKGCPFQSRCTRCTPTCKEEMPQLMDINGNEHMVACHLWQSI
jgi:peptide/nickel transport system ATP-binding protein/oligopeptide transport system ATP-binding protein